MWRSTSARPPGAEGAIQPDRLLFQQVRRMPCAPKAWEQGGQELQRVVKPGLPAKGYFEGSSPGRYAWGFSPSSAAPEAPLSRSIAFVDSPVDKGWGALSPPLCVGLDSASPLRGHSDLDLHKLLHILSLCSFLRFCCARLFFAHFPSSFSGEPPILGAPFPACQHYSTKSNIRPDINRTNIRPHML